MLLYVLLLVFEEGVVLQLNVQRAKARGDKEPNTICIHS